MTGIAPAAARASVEGELDAALAWAGRHQWTVTWTPEDLTLRADTYHRPVGRQVEVVATCDGYRALPPLWRFVRPGTNEAEPDCHPSAGPASIFHGSAIICAPWSRLAYAELGGPHGDWSGPAAWLQVPTGAIAHHLADMLALIDAHLRASPGLMA